MIALEAMPEVTAILAGLLGLLIGSFLNVVIYRLPKMMERQWAAECASLSADQAVSVALVNANVDGAAAAAVPQPQDTFNLLTPRSRCSACGHEIAWYENIPVVSYLYLRGRCSACGTGFGVRHLVVELSTGCLFAFCAWRWGASAAGLAWCGFSAALLALALIDWDTTLLPDDLTLPLLWAGLVAASLQWNPAVSLQDAVWGAAGGYLFLWSVYWAFKLATGKEGMGYGDFKLLAALGAWFGWAALIPMVLMASVIGAVVGIGMKFAGNLREGGYIPFGPFLAGAGMTAMVFGPQTILQAVGL